MDTTTKNPTEMLMTQLKETFANNPVKVMDHKGSENLLEGKKEGTYLFWKDASGALYVSGIGSQKELHHMRVEQEQNRWGGMNSGTYHAEHLNELICLCLKCDKDMIKPLSINEG